MRRLRKGPWGSKDMSDAKTASDSLKDQAVRSWRKRVLATDMEVSRHAGAPPISGFHQTPPLHQTPDLYKKRRCAEKQPGSTMGVRTMAASGNSWKTWFRGVVITGSTHARIVTDWLSEIDFASRRIEGKVRKRTSDDDRTIYNL